MTPKKIMVIAGEASGDILAAELVRALQSEFAHTGTHVDFFGAGGPRMAAVGVDLALDMTVHSVIGLVEVLRSYGKFKRIFQQLLELATAQKPDLLICVDFSGFNRRFARAVRGVASDGWKPKIVQFVSPQVWASRPGRAAKLARDIDLLLAIFPFEKEWYAQRVPDLRVEFVGHPIIDRYASAPPAALARPLDEGPPNILLLPGSRVGELKRHLLVMISAAQKIYAHNPKARFTTVLPTEELCAMTRSMLGSLRVDARTGGLAQALSEATLAIASTGTVTLECAYFGVPTIALYKTSWSTYQIGKRIVQVKFLAMPNLLAGEQIIPEFIQNEATTDAIAAEANRLLDNPKARLEMKGRLRRVIDSLGAPGAPHRAAQSVISLLEN